VWRPPNSIRHPLPETQWPAQNDAEQSLLFSKISSGRLTLNQRTWVPAMVPWRASDDGEVTPKLIEWYTRFAQGKPGAVVIEATGIRDIPSGPLLRIGHDRYIDGLTQLTQAVKEASEGETKVFIQLIDFLRVNRRPKPGVFFQRYLVIDPAIRQRMRDYFSDDRWLDSDEQSCRDMLTGTPREGLEQLLSPSSLQSLDFGHRESINDMHLPHIADLPSRLPDLFATASARASQAGFDGVELHYAHAYTMSSFLSKTNCRNDGFGGSPKARLRLPMQVYQACRTAVPETMLIGCRMLVDEIIEAGSDVADAQYYASAFAKAGMDFISLSTGGKFDDAHQPKVGEAVYPYTGESGFECMPTVYADARGPFLRNISKMASVKGHLMEQGLPTPVIVAGGIQTFEQAESVLKTKQGDIIASARQSLADPDWFLKMRSGRGDTIRRCAMTNYCEALDTRHKEVTCRLWDRVNIDEPGARKSMDGRRRLTAPKLGA
jgi:2,4-dienoyl-CoA reductase-like NADH-dependent reductase (Old Yellow Enzyme family)